MCPFDTCGPFLERWAQRRQRFLRQFTIDKMVGKTRVDREATREAGDKTRIRLSRWNSRVEFAEPKGK